jgi:hypothetical protein
MYYPMLRFVSHRNEILTLCCQEHHYLELQVNPMDKKQNQNIIYYKERHKIKFLANSTA